MQAHTCAAIAALLKSDPTVSPRERQHFLQKKDEPPEADRLVRMGEIAARLGVTKRSVTNLLADGTLPRVTLPGRKRALGTRESALAELIAGRRGVA